MSKKCYTQLKLFMEDVGSISFSAEQAQAVETYRSQYKLAVYRLNDVYEHGRVWGSHLRIYSQLSEDNAEIINSYISSAASAGCYTNVHIQNIKYACSRFCCFTQYNGIHSVAGIQYQHLERYDRFLRESASTYYIAEGLIAGFLKYLADCGLCRIGYPLFVNYMESDKCTSFKDLTESARLDIEIRRKESSIFPAEEFYQSIPHFKERLAASGYSKSFTDLAPYHLTLLFLFLDREYLGYERSIVEKWFGCVGEQLFGSGGYIARRTYEMYDDYTREGDVLPGHRWKHRKNSYDLLPSWCREELGVFIGQKKEGWDKNTLDMYLQCNIRFLPVPDIRKYQFL